MRSLILFFRKPVSNVFSIEKVFNVLSQKMPPGINVQKVTLQHTTSSIGNIFKNISFARKPKADIYHVTGDVHYLVMALPRNRTILTIHDCNFIYNSSGVKKLFFQYLFLKWPVRNCKIITTISERTKQDIVKFGGCPPGKVRVINNPVTTAVNFTEKTFNDHKPVLLFLGSTANKNLDRVAEAVKDLPCILDIVGTIPAEVEQKLSAYGIEHTQSAGLTEDQLVQKYASCDLLVFPSLFEGFGLPIIEAQKAGRAVLTSNISPMKEVAGDGACLVDPYDVTSIRNGIIKLIEDAAYRQQLIQNGLENVKRFDAASIALEYYSLYNEIAAQATTQ